MTIPALIDKTDTFELIRDKIAEILATETVSQQALASAAGEDPDAWKLRVYKERSNPWEQFLNSTTDVSPVVNVWFDSSSADARASNAVDRQKYQGTFNVDIIGFGRSAPDGSGGHTPGDRAAAIEMHRALRLVRNILMSSVYTYLDMRGTVWGRWVSSVTSFQPQLDAQQVQHISGGRIALQVDYNELAPQGDEANLLEIVGVTVYNDDTGEVYFEAEWDYTEE